MKKKWSVSKRKRRNRAKKKYINAPIKQNKGIFQFPFACEDKNSNLIFWFMNFCKGKFSKVVHISKEDLKYYIIFFNRNSNKKFRDLSDIPYFLLYIFKIT
jgi:hypothetical protein